MKKYILGAVLSLGILMTPAASYAAGLTSVQIQSILSLLSAFGADSATIANVTTALNGGTPSTTSGGFCHRWNTDLTVGSTGADVTALNQALTSSGIDTTGNTSFFSENNAGDVVSFQSRYGIRQTGYVGPMTRAKLNALYGCESTVVMPPAPVKTTPVSPQDAAQLSVAVSERFVPSNNIIAGSSGALVGTFTFYATGSSYTVSSLSVLVPRSAANSVSNVTIKYKDKYGATRSSSSALIYGTANAKAIFTGLTLHVPEIGRADFYVYIDTNTIADGATSGAAITVSLGTEDFSAINADGSIVRKINSATPDVLVASDATFYVRKSVPTFSVIREGYSVVPKTGSPLYRFSITADPAGHISWFRLGFNISAKSASLSNVYLVDEGSGIKITEPTVVETGTTLLVPGTVKIVGAGTTRKYALYGTVTGWGPGATLSIDLAEDMAPVANGPIGSVLANVVWSDWFDFEGHAADSPRPNTTDWTNGYRLKDLKNDGMLYAEPEAPSGSKYQFSFKNTSEFVLQMAVKKVPLDLRYDINKDGKVTSADALAYLSQTSIPQAITDADKAYVVGLMSVGTVPADLAYDINKDGKVTSADALQYEKLAAPAPYVTSTFSAQQQSGMNAPMGGSYTYQIQNYRSGLVLDVEPTVNCNDTYIAPYKRDCSQYWFNLSGKAAESYTNVQGDPYVKGGALYRFTGSNGLLNLSGYINSSYVPGSYYATPQPDSIDFKFILRDSKSGEVFWSETRTVGFKG